MLSNVDQIRSTLLQARTETERFARELREFIGSPEVPLGLSVRGMSVSLLSRCALDQIAADIHAQFEAPPGTRGAPRFPITNDPLEFHKRMDDSFPCLKRRFARVHRELESMQPFNARFRPKATFLDFCSISRHQRLLRILPSGTLVREVPRRELNQLRRDDIDEFHRCYIYYGHHFEGDTTQADARLAQNWQAVFTVFQAAQDGE